MSFIKYFFKTLIKNIIIIIIKIIRSIILNIQQFEFINPFFHFFSLLSFIIYHYDHEKVY